MKIVSFEEFSISYSEGSAPALAGIDLELMNGESVVVSGLSGSGKSTLCLAAAGLLDAFPAMKTTGRIERKGTGTNAAPRIAIVLQNFYSQITYLRPTVVEEIAFPCENLGLPRAETARRVAETIDRLRIGHIAGSNPLELSGGEKQKVVLAAAIAVKPDLLILDEPLSQLDPETTAYLGDVLAGLKKNMSLMIAENDPYLMLKVADRLVVLSEGRIAADGSPGTAVNSSTVNLLDLPAWTTCLMLARKEGIAGTAGTVQPYELNYRHAMSALKGTK